jgi:hypothetical protein
MVDTSSTAQQPATVADPQAPASAAPAPVVTLINPDDIPPGWELATQQLRRIRVPGAAPAAAPIRPTAPVMSATAGAGIGPLIGYLASTLGHPIPPDVMVALTILTTFLAGWLHPAGRGTST